MPLLSTPAMQRTIAYEARLSKNGARPRYSSRRGNGAAGGLIMSRRLSKKSRATKLATNVAFSAANLPKLESSVLDALFARSPERKRSLRTSLMVGTVLSAGILTTSLVNVSPALAACTGTTTVTCSGDFPTAGGGLPAFLDPVTTTVDLTGAIVGGHATN